MYYQDPLLHQNGQQAQTSGLNQMMMVAVYPMMASLFATVFQSLITDLKTLLIKMFNFLYLFSEKIANKYIFNKYDEENELHISLVNTEGCYNSVYEHVVPEGMPLVWYLNNYCTTNNTLKCAKLYVHAKKTQKEINYEMDTGESIETSKTEKQLFYIPILKENQSYQQNLQHDENHNNNNNNNNQNNRRSRDQEGKQSLSKKTKFGFGRMEITKDIFMEIIEKTISTPGTAKNILCAVLKSNRKTISEIGEFYDKIRKDYEVYNTKKMGKLYVYNGTTKNYSTGQMEASYSCFDLDPSQSFDNIFVKNKEQIIEDIKNLADKEYFRKHGIKRKVSQLYVGPPGSGKTCLVSAIAKMTGRCVMYIPISRIKSNLELQEIIYERFYNNTYYEMDEVIFLADELDTLESLTDLKKNNGENNKNDKQNNQTIVINTNDNKGTSNVVSSLNNDSDKLNIGIILNILDGNNDQEGMIFIGTANSKEKLDEAIYRTGRMDLIEFEYMDRDCIRNMIEHYYETKLTEEQYYKIKNDKTVQSLNLKNLCLKYIRRKKQNEITVDMLIEELNILFDNVDKNNLIYEKFPKIETNEKEEDDYSDYSEGSDKSKELDGTNDIAPEVFDKCLDELSS